MRRICAWCDKDLGAEGVSAGAAAPITHGICRECAARVLAEDAPTLREFLDHFEGPVLAVDGAGRVITANQRAAGLLGKSLEDVEGRPGGDAIECEYAGLPEGCGATVHCRTCTIRKVVTDTMSSGSSHCRTPAYPDLHTAVGPRRVRFLITTERIAGFVMLRIDEIGDTDPDDP